MRANSSHHRGCSRRHFLKVAGGLVGGAVLYATLMPIRESLLTEVAAETGKGQEEEAKHYWGFVVDSTRCIGCGRCVLACKRENNVPLLPEYNRTWVERYRIKLDGEILVDSPEGGIHGFAGHDDPQSDNGRVAKAFFVPKLCNQCEKPPCVQVCPVAATYKTEDGVVLVDQKRCIGCGYCIQACPYGARYLVPDVETTPTGQVRVADKCTWCYHRITKGLQPACVEVCPVGARMFGDLNDPQSTVSKILEEKRVTVLKPDLGTKPKVYYVGLEEGVR